MHSCSEHREIEEGAGLRGQAGRIRVYATDNVQVAKVLVTILNEQGETLAQGEVALINDLWWEYESAAPNDGKVIVEAFDLAGNCTRNEAWPTLARCFPLSGCAR